MHRARWTFILIITLFIAFNTFAAQLASIDVELQSSITGEYTIYNILFETITPIHKQAHFKIYFDLDFDLSQMIMASSVNTQTMDGGIDINTIFVENNRKVVQLTRTGTDINGDGAVGIALAMVGNPQPGQYTLDLEIYEQDWTPSDFGTANPFDIILPRTITNFSVDVSLLNPVAGEPFQVIVTNARDDQGKLTDGIINISFENGTMEDHKAPDGKTLPFVSSVNIVGGSGSSWQTLYKVENVRLKCTVQDGGLSILTDPITVNPAELNFITLQGYPDSSIAGQNFGQSNIIIGLFDSWKNLKTDFAGNVFFSSSDANALLTFHETNPFIFDGSQNGTQTFSGSNFQLRTAGLQTLSIHSGNITETSSSIFVKAAPIATFNFDLVQNQIAGVPFNVKVINALDNFGNKGTGSIAVFATTGGNSAPNGQVPIFNTIAVNAGTGLAAQTFVKTENVQLAGREETTLVTNTTNIFTINPNNLSSFQVSGYPQSIPTNSFFSDSVIVYAYDAFGNDKKDFNGTVQFSSTDTNPSVLLPAPYTFQNTNRHAFAGTQFRLVTLGTQTINITSGAISHKSGPISVTDQNEIRILRVISDRTTVSRGQQGIPVSLDVLNNSSVAYTQYEANLKFEAGPFQLDNDYIAPPNRGTGIGAMQQTLLPLTVQVKETATLGAVTIDGTLGGYFVQEFVSLDHSEVTDSWTVQRQAQVGVKQLNISQDIIYQGSSGIPISLTLANNESLDLSANAIIDSCAFYFVNDLFTDVSEYFSIVPDPINPGSVSGGNTGLFRYYLSCQPNTPAGRITVGVKVYYRDTNILIAKMSDSGIMDEFSCSASPILSLTEIKPLDQPSVTQGQDKDFFVRVGIENEGTSPLSINFDSQATHIKFLKGSTEYISPNDVEWPTTLVSGGTVINPGLVDFIEFKVTRVASNVPSGNLLIFARVETAGGFYTNSNISNVYGGIEVQTPDNLTINWIRASQKTATKSDTTKPWFVSVLLENKGGSDVKFSLEETNITFKDINQTEIAGFRVELPYLSKKDSTLSGGEIDTLFFPVTRTSEILGLAKIDASIFYQVLNTGTLKNIITSNVGETTSVTVQDSAKFNIVQVKNQQKSITQGATSSWKAAVQIKNDGQADLFVDLQSPDSTWLKFYQNDAVVSSFQVEYPTALFGAKTDTLKGGKIDSLVYTITSSTVPLGTFDIKSAVKTVEFNRDRIFYDATVTDRFDSVKIVAPSQVYYVAGSLSPRELSPSRYVEFILTVRNDGDASISLDPELTTFSFSDGVRTFTSTLDGSYGDIIPGNGTLQLYFKKKYISTSFFLGTYEPKVQLVGDENGQPFNSQLNMLGEVIRIGEAGEFFIESVNPSTSTVTLGQIKPWTIKIGITNNSSRTLLFKQATVTFNSNTVDVSDKFTYIHGDTLANGQKSLPQNATEEIPVLVTSVAPTAPLGQILMSVHIVMADSTEPSLTIEERKNNANTITVQNPADLKIISYSTSQNSVTRGQNSPWTISAKVRNQGESDLSLLSQNNLSFLRFSKGDDNFQVSPPLQFLGSKNTKLSGNSEDSLRFFINSVAGSPQMLGDCEINAHISMQEINTGRVLKDSTNSLSQKILVAIQDSAAVRIDSLIAFTKADSFVNAGEEFYLKALVTNIAQTNAETVSKAIVKFVSTFNSSFFVHGDTASVTNIPAGESKWTEPGLLVKAPNNAGIREIFHARVISAISKNYNGQVKVQSSQSPQDTTAIIRTQTPAQFEFVDLTTDVDTVTTGSHIQWHIFATLTNKGDGEIDIVGPQSNDIQVVGDPNYLIEPPVLTPEQRRLSKGEMLMLDYTVKQTGVKAGNVVINVSVFGQEVNNPAKDPIQLTRQTNVFVSTSSAVRLVETKIDSLDYNTDAFGNGLVNINQRFVVKVKVANEGGQLIGEAKVQLFANKSQVLSGEQTLRNISSSKEASFWVKAANEENLTGEVLTARIISALGNDGGNAVIKTPLDSTTTIKIYQPAQVRIISTQNLIANQGKYVSFGQYFDVAVKVKNLGSEAVKNVIIGLNSTNKNLASPELSPLTIKQQITGGDTGTVKFRLKTGTTEGTVGLVSNIQQAIGANSDSLVSILDPGTADSTFARVSQGASLVLDNVFSNVQNINGGDVGNPWSIFVQISNKGLADLEFVDIEEENVSFSVNDQLDAGYKVIPPTRLKKAPDFILKAQQTDTLIYTVTENGKLSGEAIFTVFLKAKDLNTNGDSLLTGYKSGSVSVSSEAYVQIVETSIISNVTDINGSGLINRGQDFQVQVKVHAGQYLGAENVVIELTSDGNSITDPRTFTITAIERDQFENATFNIVADNSWDEMLGEKQEVFQARLVSAFSAGSDQPAGLRPPVKETDATARLRIQTPAELSYHLQIGEYSGTTVSIDKEFELIARMRNNGKAPIGVGRIRVTPPPGYRIENGENNFIAEPVDKAFSLGDKIDSIDVKFTFLAPSEISGPDIIRSTLSIMPQDLNANRDVFLGDIQDTVLVKTAQSAMIISSFVISEPPGALNDTLSTEQLFKLQAVIQTTQNILNRKATLNLPNLGTASNYQFLSPQAINLYNEIATVTWELQAPSASVKDVHFFELVVSGDVQGETIPEERRTLSIKRVESRAALVLEPITVWPEEVMQDDQVYLTTGQDAKIRTRIRNSGEARLVGEGIVKIDLKQSALTLVNNDSVKNFNQDTILEWEVRAPVFQVPEPNIIEVRIIQTPVDANSGKSVFIAPGQAIREINVRTEVGGKIEVPDLWIRSPDGSRTTIVSTEQGFDVVAKINAMGVKENPITAHLMFNSQAFSVLEPVKTLPSSGEGLEQNWAVVAPIDSIDGADSLFIRVTAKDLRSGNTITTTSQKVPIWVQQRTAFSIEPYLYFPSGLTTKLSTGQNFDIAAKIRHSGADFTKKDSFVVKCIPPIGYDFIEGSDERQSIMTEEYLAGQSPIWNLKAPNEKPADLSRFEFLVEKVPNDINTHREADVTKSSVFFTVQTINHAQVKLEVYIHDTPGADSVNVRLGNVFKLTSWLHNFGDAKIKGAYKVQLDLPKNVNYALASSSDTLVKTSTFDAISWLIQAPQPDILPLLPDSFKITLLEKPIDEFSQIPVEVIDSVAVAQVVLETGKMILKKYDVRENTAVVKGQSNIPMLGLSLKNKDGAGGIKSIIKGMKLSFRDKLGNIISPSPLISRIAAVKHRDNNKIYGELSSFESGMITLDFLEFSPDTVIGERSDSINIIVDISSAAPKVDFKLTIDSTNAIKAYDDSGKPLVMADSAGNPLTYIGIASTMAVVIDENLDEAFFNYPNPFGKVSKPVTNFLYYLKEESDVQINIYTITGELVRIWQFTRAEHPNFTSEGLHQGELVWDGTNGYGMPVVNGIYLAYISTDYGEKAVTKIAVVR